MNTLTYNGRSSDTLSLYIGSVEVDNAPKRNIQSISVPGRNGELTIDENSYANISVTYTCYIKEDFDVNIAAAREFFLSSPGYHRLQDSFNPLEYRMARCVNGMNVTPSQMREQGYFRLVFDAMPQRFLISGDASVEFEDGGTIINPSAFSAKPLIRIVGAGTVGIGAFNVTFDGSSPYVDVDCDLQDAYYGATNKNSSITLSPNRFPTLGPGATGIIIGSGVESVVITPRWWTL